LRRRQGKDTPATPSSFPYYSACPPRLRASPADPIAFFLLRFGMGNWPLPRRGPPPPVLAVAVPSWSAFCRVEGRLIAEGKSVAPKYDLRTKFFTPYQKAQQHFACSDTRVVEDQWKILVQIWSSEEFKFLKTMATLDRGDLFIRTRIKKAGGPVNEESAAMIDKIRDIKLTQQSSTSSLIASMWDTYEQVMGRDRTGRVRGIGTGPTPKSLWDSLAGRRVRILNFSGQVVASDILMSDDNDNVVMGMKLGGEYYEFVCCNLSWSKEKASSFGQITNLLPPHVNNFIY
ncbi:hypothetical protein Taro_037920, partial [Colocasia esculenta]|nr:hypothetical protein [Colocasia esculenta]